MTLYHGSNTEIEKIDINKCKPFKDFGRGFYTTSVLEQAWAMAGRTVRIFKTGFPCVTEFVVDDALFENAGLTVKKFDKPDNHWARFVMHNRNRHFTDLQNTDCNTDGKYDVVIGPVANDDIAALLDVYLTGIISDDALAKELAFRDLSIQFSFHTPKSFALLKKTGALHG